MNNSIILKQIILFIVFIIFIGKIQAQDIAFDQFQKAPTYLNPALTGVISGNYRLNTLYHSQWSGQLNSGINAFYAGGDVKFERNTQKGMDFFGLGLSFLNDEYNEFRLSTKTLSINTSYHKLLDDRSKQYIGIGLQLGINQKNLNYENLSFEDQFNQLDQYNLNTAELLPQNNFGYFDLATGLFYSVQAATKTYLNIGVSYAHINAPNISFYKEVKDPINSLEQSSKLYSKWTIHSSGSIFISDKLYFIPDFLYQKQGPHQQIIIGTRLKLNLNYEDPNDSFTIGMRAKLSKNVENSNLSSFIVLSEYKRQNLIFGFSYNILLQPVIVNQLSFNTFEFSLRYTGQYNNDEYYCPEF